MSGSSQCGPHAQLVANDRVRITQCPCGTYHLSFVKKGITVQVDLDDIRSLVEGGSVVKRVAEAEERGRALGAHPRTTPN